MLIKKPHLINLVLDNEDEFKKTVTSGFSMPRGLPTVSISNFVDNSEEIYPCSFLEGSSLVTDFALLKGICKKFNVEDYLEIGTWRGESAANVAPFVKNCITINLPDETMRKNGMDEKYISMHRYYSKKHSNIVHIEADSQSFDFSSLNKKFDLIFLDGDHHYQSIVNDTKNAMNLLKDNNSMIVWHDCGFGTETSRYEVIAGILQGLPKSTHHFLYRVSNTLCAIYSKLPLESDFIDPNSPPNLDFSVSLKYRKI